MRWLTTREYLKSTEVWTLEDFILWKSPLPPHLPGCGHTPPQPSLRSRVYSSYTFLMGLADLHIAQSYVSCHEPVRTGQATAAAAAVNDKTSDNDSISPYCNISRSLIPLPSERPDDHTPRYILYIRRLYIQVHASWTSRCILGLGLAWEPARARGAKLHDVAGRKSSASMHHRAKKGT